jgi:hypothetical protein
MSMLIKQINPEIDTRWDSFVLEHPHGSIYHHSTWAKVVQSTYKYVPFYVGLEQSESGQLVGIVPFLLVGSRFTGKRLVSLPFTSYCEPLVPERQITNIINFAKEYFPDVEYLGLRFLEDNVIGHCEKETAFVTHILDLDVELERLFKSFHPTSVRQRIKRAEKKQLKFSMVEQEEDLKRFYGLLTRVRKKHGLPPPPYKFFSNMWKLLKPKGLLLAPVLEYEGETIAAAIVLRYKNTFHFEYSASDQNYLKLCPNQKLIWETIKIAHKEEARYFDFGRSSLVNHPLVEFKDRWGTRRRHLTYCYYPKGKRSNAEDGMLHKILKSINHHLPDSVLQMEGKLVYPHWG